MTLYGIVDFVPPCQVLECMYIRQAIDLLEGLLPTGDEGKDISTVHMQKLILFAIMFSAGALLEIDDRKKVCVGYYHKDYV